MTVPGDSPADTVLLDIDGTLMDSTGSASPDVLDAVTSAGAVEVVDGPKELIAADWASLAEQVPAAPRH